MPKSREIQLKIEDVAFGGDGVGRHEGKAVFVPFVLPGEEVRVEIVEEKKNFARARLVQVVKASAARQDSRCPYFGPCPGCRYLHVQYDAQLQMKVKQVGDLLRRIGKLKELPPIEAIPSPAPYEYRNKIKLHVEKSPATPGKNWKVGYIGEDNHKLVDIERCLIARPEINEALAKFRAAVAADPRELRGAWLTRVDAAGGRAHDFYFQEGKEFTETLPLLKEEVRGKPFFSPFGSFFQTNPGMLEKLVDAAERSLSLSKETVLIDAYCGVGLFSLLLAEQAREAIGIEEDPRAIRVARQNAATQMTPNVKFIGAKVEEALPKILKDTPAKTTKLLLDPPRVGCHSSVLETLKKNPIPEIVYVSCNPATLARDLEILSHQGYRATHISLVDMFPQTAHIESVAKLILT